ncbi:spermatogenesis-defective protein 39 homolog [Coccinella septempunctata]|uniref:spermatogenesis-defective protein 39 homolog n=1 Tax=Coccinella septempunctata TaxID=41139 RepID=UPI001D090134|nr:spermatogenesis-defective protein 39 homolog [Coccinella septempunctata]
MSNLNDDYWNSSSTSKFSFDDEDLSASQIDSVANDVFSSKQEEINIFAIDFIISKKCLDLLLADVDTENIHMVSTPSDAVRKMVRGNKVVLEQFKSYKDKIQLIDEALTTYNGDIILRVTDFLRTTLKFSLFCNVLVKRRAALVHYADFVKLQGNLEELENLYMATGFTTNIKDLYFLNTRCEKNKHDTLNKLKYFISSHSHYLDSFNERKLLSDYVRFLEWQITNGENSNSVVEQLALVCKKQWEQSTDDDQVVAFKNLFRVDEAQYEWTVMNCLCYLGLWKKLIGMFVKPNWFTKKNVLKSVINSDIFIWGVSRHDPPKNVIDQLLTCLSDSDKSLAFAEKFQCYKFMIEYYINQRDRTGLLGCIDKVAANSEEYFMIKKALESQDKRWKN